MTNCPKKNMIFALAAVLVICFMIRQTIRSPAEKYILSPTPITTDDKVQNGSVGESLLKLPYTRDCTPGPYPKGSYYTIGLNPGGICGDQAYVNSAMHAYKILTGIGGSLLAN